MNDAYTIGLTLALDDGVSAGIASIRRELSALDQAVVASIANLAWLQDAARAAITVGVAGAGATAATTRGFAAAAVRQARPAETTIEVSPPATAPSSTTHTDVPAPAAVQKPAQAVPLTRSDNAASAVPAGSRVAPEKSTTATSLARQESLPAAADVQGLVRPATAPRPIAPVALDPRSLVMPPAATPATTAAPVQDQPKPRDPAAPPPSTTKVVQLMAAAPAPVAVESIQTAPVSPVVVEVGQRDRPSAPMVRPEAVKLQPASSHRLQHQAPAATSIAPAARGTQMAPASERPRNGLLREPVTSTAPRQHVERSRDKPMSGTITVDGIELGRWMADHMAHAASRPPVGGVGFDPRMSPVWAGAPIGA